MKTPFTFSKIIPLLFCCVFLHPGFCKAQDVFTCYLGLPWGCSVGDAKTMLDQQQEITSVSNSPDELIYSGGAYLGFPVLQWKFSFSVGRLNAATLTFKRPVDSKGIDPGAIYDRFLHAATILYGASVFDPHPDHCSSTWKVKETLESKGDKQFTLYRSWKDHVLTLTLTNSPASSAPSGVQATGSASASFFGKPNP